MQHDWLSSVSVWGLAVLMVSVILPQIELRTETGIPLGLPIRGYGVMVLAGLMAGIGITIWRGNQLGVQGERIVSLGFWMMIGGVLGARLFYVIQKWDQFDGLTFFERLIESLKLTEGGLVIYGGVFGGLAAGTIYCLRNRMAVLATADLIAPGFLIGLSFGRLGCLLHGCCYGGICTADLPSITFPKFSVPYQAQLENGRLLGIHLASRSDGNSVIEDVEPQGLASQHGLTSGAMVQSIQLLKLSDEETTNPALPSPVVTELRADNQLYRFWPNELLTRSLPVHPSQIYASINALLLCVLVWLIQPIPKHDGIAFLVAILLYSISRFLLEWIRSDEAGQLGTSFTISQIISACGFITATLTIIGISLRPASRFWDWRAA